MHVGQPLVFSDSDLGISGVQAVVGDIERTNDSMRVSVYAKL